MALPEDIEAEAKKMAHNFCESYAKDIDQLIVDEFKKSYAINFEEAFKEALVFGEAKISKDK